MQDWTWETDSTPLEAVGDGPCGFVGAADKHSCNEGRIKDQYVKKTVEEISDLIDMFNASGYG